MYLLEIKALISINNFAKGQKVRRSRIDSTSDDISNMFLYVCVWRG